MSAPFFTDKDVADFRDMAESVMLGTGTTGDLWGLTDYGDHFDQPHTGPLATGVICYIETANTLSEPGLPEKVQALGVDMKEYRRIHLPWDLVERPLDVRTNWMFTTHTGTASERDYNVVNDPDIDGVYPIELVLDCALTTNQIGRA